jgi:hypothetical protein
MDKEKLEEKVNNFIKENNMNLLNKDPTDMYLKLIQQTIQKCNILIDKQIHRYLMNIKPKAPKLNAYVKTHKDNQPIRPVINNTQAPSYKIARFINKSLKSILNLPHTYNVENSQQVAQELLKLQTTNKIKFITLDIKDLYVILPVSGIVHTTQLWLQKHNNHNKQLNHQILNILCTIIK